MRTTSEPAFRMAVVFAITLAACGHETTSPAAQKLTPVPPLTAQNSIDGDPVGWQCHPGQPPHWTYGLESADTHGGQYAAFIANTSPVVDTAWMTMGQLLRADAYAGHRVKLSGWFRPTDVVLPPGNAFPSSGPISGLWMEVDGDSVIYGFDNMQNRPVVGTTDWQQVSIVLDVPVDAIGITFGVLFNGTGQLLVDDLALDTVSVAVPTTNLYLAPVPAALNATLLAPQYRAAPIAPVNLDFDGGVQASAWWRVMPRVTGAESGRSYWPNADESASRHTAPRTVQLPSGYRRSGTD